MIKSLYVRVVLTFLGVILMSLVLTVVVDYWFYGKKLELEKQDSLIVGGKAIIHSIEESDQASLEAIMQGLMAIPVYTLKIYTEDKLLFESILPNSEEIQISTEQLEYVLKGGVYRSDFGPGKVMIGLPFQVKGLPHALFIAPREEFLLGGLAQLSIILFFGCVLILIAARYIVTPLQRLTRATRRMAKGDFSIQLQTKRKDEIGQLTASFNQMAKELGMLEQIRQQFVSNVSHEIQSPLTSIKGFTQALMHKKMDEPARIRLLSIIEEESMRLSRLSESLLQLSSLESEHLQLHPRHYPLDEQLRKVVIAYEPQWTAKKLNVELELDEIDICADEDRLNQLWNNLLSNCIKFTGEGGTVQISAAKKKDQIVVAFTDSGKGIPEAEFSSIFKAFYKVDKSRDGSVHGSGIGLSIVKRIADLHQSDIQVSSRVGEGTKFTVTLPEAPLEEKM
ncbi:sensor histidine kinase [Paenibacillus eucommiae]|uniref:Heme sensor protein HssS n=1 Tax=Paenibacillus eucommiae TaxID=1355755 RepID=A0ABS4JAU7_9BACL|nr:HAMP domain-containing sensor histidine kinase [Paenibacillus eucommiae]MBP1996355.1 signal transduction histidine kinase [Paenibacillus eucommiae]